MSGSHSVDTGFIIQAPGFFVTTGYCLTSLDCSFIRRGLGWKVREKSKRIQKELLSVERRLL